MRILLISPSSEDDVFSNSSIREAHYLGAKAFFAPHSIAAVAALTPREHEVLLHDEGLQGSVIPRLGRERFDVVGISLKATQIGRALTIARAFRRMRAQGALVVGGIGVTYLLSQLRDQVDTIFFGEAENTWREYLSDLEQGQPKTIYQHATKPDMTKVPPPRWELIADDIAKYLSVSVQTTRGCHLDCDFCDVIYTFGRTPRVKTPAQILDEVRRLERLGVRVIYFADDNFCVHKAETKAFLRQLIEVNNAFEVPMAFITQIDITIAKDDELLELLADSNFMEVQIGIESTAPDALGDLNKKANLQVDLVEAVRKIQSYGPLVMAHMIIGADFDDGSAFQRTLDFIDDANVVHHFCHPLAAPPGTRLWYRLKREGRIVAPVQESFQSGEMVNNIDVITNIIPHKMSRAELLEGVADTWERGHDLDRHRRRILGYIEDISRIPKVKRPGLAMAWKNRAMMSAMFRHFLFGVGSQHRKLFFDLVATAGRKDPSLVQRAIFAHSTFLMERARALTAVRLARSQADWERANPNALGTLPPSTPIPLAVRQSAKKIFEPAYFHVRGKVDDGETIYKVVIDAMIDYTERFGETFEGIDEQHLEHIRESCDRALSRVEPPPLDPASSMPADRLPRGFVREILDSVDLGVRVKEG